MWTGDDNVDKAGIDHIAHMTITSMERVIEQFGQITVSTIRRVIDQSGQMTVQTNETS